jgi:proteic killer suppression protein
MVVEFDDPDLAKVAAGDASAGHGEAVDKGIRKVINFIKQAKDERDFRSMRSLNFEKMQGKYAGYHTFRINDQWRLFVAIRGEGESKRIGVVKVDDPH